MCSSLLKDFFSSGTGESSQARKRYRACPAARGEGRFPRGERTETKVDLSWFAEIAGVSFVKNICCKPGQPCAVNSSFVMVCIIISASVARLLFLEYFPYKPSGRIVILNRYHIIAVPALYAEISGRHVQILIGPDIFR